MKRMMAVLMVILLLVTGAFSTGCARQYLSKPNEAYLAQDISWSDGKITTVAFKLDPVLDLAEGGDGRFSWMAVMFTKDGHEIDFLAMNIGQVVPGGPKAAIVSIPLPLSMVQGNYIALLDHGGTRIYNHKGEFRMLESKTKKIKVGEYADFLTRIEPGVPYVQEVSKGTPEYEGLVKYYQSYRLRQLNEARDYLVKKYGQRLLTSLDERQWRELCKKDSIANRAWEWLGGNWYLFVTGAMKSGGDLFISWGIAKVLTVSEVWKDRIDLPGYFEWQHFDMEAVAKVAYRAVKEYSGATYRVAPKETAPSATKTHPLPAELREKIKQETGKDFESFEEYNAFAAGYNAAVEKNNQEIQGK